MSGVYICFPVIHAILTSCLCQKSVSWGDVAADGLDRELLEMMRLRYSHCAKVCRSFWANIPPKTPEQHEKVVVEDLRLSAVVPLGPEFCILLIPSCSCDVCTKECKNWTTLFRTFGGKSHQARKSEYSEAVVSHR